MTDATAVHRAMSDKKRESSPADQLLSVRRHELARWCRTPSYWRNARATYGSKHMAWNTPKIVEIALGAEINCYACAELTA